MTVNTETAEYARASLVPVKDIEESPWNVNVCPPEKYATLKADLKTSGPKGTDPIHVCVLGGKQYTIDGAHRLRAAKELGWPVIYVYFHDEVTTEDQARLFNYKRDAERGDIDAFKLAGAFKWFLDGGLKQKDIAAKFGVDDTTVSRRLSLLKVDEKVREQVATDSKMGVSHLEQLAPLPAPLQQKVLEAVKEETRSDRKEPVTTRQMERAIEEVKKEDEREKAIQKVLQDPRVKPEFRKCPRCKSEPESLVTDRWCLWPGAELVVRDRRYHDWSLITGLKPEPKRTSSRRSSSGNSRPPQHEKSKVPFAVYAQAARNFFDRVWPRLTDVDSLTWSGKASKSKTSVSFEGKELQQVSASGKLDGKAADLFLRINKYAVDLEFGSVEAKFERNSSNNKAFASYVRTHGTLMTRKDLHQMEEKAVDFLEEYGGLPRGKNPDWERIQKRLKAKK